MFFMIQIFGWKNFQVWVLHNNSSQIMKKYHMKSSNFDFFTKIEILFLGWVLIKMSSYVENMKVWWYKMFLIVIFHSLKSLRTFKKSTNFLHFWCQKFVGWIFWSLQLLKKIIFTYQIKYFHMEYDHISSPKIYCKLNYHLFW